MSHGDYTIEIIDDATVAGKLPLTETLTKYIFDYSIAKIAMDRFHADINDCQKEIDLYNKLGSTIAFTEEKQKNLSKKYQVACDKMNQHNQKIEKEVLWIFDNLDTMSLENCDEYFDAVKFSEPYGMKVSFPYENNIHTFGEIG